MYKGIAGSEGIGIGNVVIIEEHEIVIENKKITDTDAEIARLQGAIEKFVNDTNAMADRMEKTEQLMSVTEQRMRISFADISRCFRIRP